MGQNFITVGLVGFNELADRLEKYAPEVRVALQRKVTEFALLLEAYVKTNKLSGQVLNKITGSLSASIQHRVEAVGSAIWGFVFSAGDVKYAAIHEYGGVIPAHDIYPTKAQALAFAMGGDTIFAKHVHIPEVHMPERSYLRSSLQEWAQRIETGLKQTAIDTLQNMIDGTV